VLKQGHMDDGIWTTGQSQALIHDIPTCAQLVHNIMSQAEAIIDERLVGARKR
jgi:nitronate monooxygenase